MLKFASLASCRSLQNAVKRRGKKCRGERKRLVSRIWERIKEGNLKRVRKKIEGQRKVKEGNRRKKGEEKREILAKWKK